MCRDAGLRVIVKYFSVSMETYFFLKILFGNIRLVNLNIVRTETQKLFKPFYFNAMLFSYWKPANIISILHSIFYPHGKKKYF